MASALLVSWVLILSVNAESCNYVTFSVDMDAIKPINIGTFSISTNRCQSLKATFKNKDAFQGIGFTLPFDGSMMMKCVEFSEKYYRIEVNLYEDALCKTSIDDNDNNEPLYIDIDDNKFKIYNNLQFTLNEMNCNSPWKKDEEESCGISMEMANNCSWSKSDRYMNISVPDNKCISLAPDFSGLLVNIPGQILPQEFVDDLEKQSLQFRCCSSDNSLLITNYSDTTCEIEPDSQFRIHQMYNGKCFVIGNDEDMIENKDEREGEIDFNENTQDTYVYIMRWKCNDFEHECDEKGIPFRDGDMLPQPCSEECVEMEKQQDNEDNEDNGAASSSSNSSSSRGNKIIGVVVVVVVVVALFIGIIAVSVWYGRKKAMQNQVERAMAGNINVNVKDEKLVQGDDKYEAFVTETEEETDQDNVDVLMC